MLRSTLLLTLTALLAWEIVSQAQQSALPSCAGAI